MATKKLTTKKTDSVAQIKDLLSKSKSVAIVDYTGLKVAQATELRKLIRKSGGEYVVTKNTLFKIASNNTDMKLEGLSGFVFSTDEVASIKAVADFAKKNGVLKLKGGLLGTSILSESEIIQLASLPDKATLVSKMLGSIKSPLFNLTYNLNWNISKLVRTLDAVAKSKS
jgi:large subunit ribosomal protein L10